MTAKSKMAVTETKILGKSAQKNALKCQLNVRKTILEQPANKEAFAFSKEKKTTFTRETEGEHRRVNEQGGRGIWR